MANLTAHSCFSGALSCDILMSMAWRIADSVVSGWLDNRERGRVRGELQLLDRADPVQLDLRGDVWPDLAGCRIEFTNPAPKPGDLTSLAAGQCGVAGDMTAARKCRVFDVPIEEAMRRARAGLPVPEHLANTLYLEWFSERNGRVVLETCDFEIRVSAHAWTMTEAEDQARAAQANAALLDFMGALSDASPAGAALDDADDEADGGPMDEFEAEAFLREGDQRSERYRIALEKYRDHPDCDRLVAREMGWDHLEDALEADARGAFDDEKAADLGEDLPELIPNPLTEGRDWVPDEDGRPIHPLVLRARTLAVDIWRRCDALGLLQDSSPPDVLEMASQAQCMSAKLAGALNHLAYQDRPDRGLLIAWTKRALPFLSGSLTAAQRVAEANLLPPDLLALFRDELLAIRAEILVVMQRYRDEG